MWKLFLFSSLFIVSWAKKQCCEAEDFVEECFAQCLEEPSEKFLCGTFCLVPKFHVCNKTINCLHTTAREFEAWESTGLVDSVFEETTVSPLFTIFADVDNEDEKFVLSTHGVVSSKNNKVKLVKCICLTCLDVIQFQIHLSIVIT